MKNFKRVIGLATGVSLYASFLIIYYLLLQWCWEGFVPGVAAKVGGIFGGVAWMFFVALLLECNFEGRGLRGDLSDTLYHLFVGDDDEQPSFGVVR